MVNRMRSSRTAIAMLYRAIAALACVATGISTANADTLLMPKRDGILGEPIVVWGVTTLPVAAATTYKFMVGSTTIASGAVTATSIRAFLNTSYLFPSAGTHTVTLEVKNGATTETATVQVQIFDPANMEGPGSKVMPVGPGSNEIYRKLRINMAIQDGLRYLWTAQTSLAANFPGSTETSWSGAPWWTAMVVTAFENHGYRLSNDGSAPTGVYEKYIVQRGLNYVIGQLSPRSIGTGTTAAFLGQPLDRDPCVGVGIERVPVAGQPLAISCTGLAEDNQSQGYSNGIAMMPLAASGALDRINTTAAPAIAQNKPYREILQRLANTLSWGQIDSANTSRGGWSYHMNDNFFDGSVMGWAMLGLLDAKAVGVVVPDWVKTELASVIPLAINNNGSFDYRVDGPTVNNTTHMSKAGIPLQGLFMMGEIGGARVNSVVNYIAGRWTFNARVAPTTPPQNPDLSDTYASPCGAFFNRGCAYSMFNIFKGLKLQNIATLPGAVFRAAGPGGILANDWHADYEDWLVNFQVPGAGHWAGRASPAPAIPTMSFTPQGTNDASGNAAIAELLLAGVALVLPDADKFATVGLSPLTNTLVEGGTHTVTAFAQSTDGAPVPGATVNFNIISGPNAGAFTGTDVTDENGLATFTYTDPGPLRTFGTDRIRANIGTLLSNIVEMIWLPFNRPPVANPNTYTHDEDTVLSGNVITDAPADTDPDPEDLVLTAALVSDVAHGALVLNINGSFTYTPAPNFCGTDGFSYDLNDGEEDGNVAAVTIDVKCVNDAPVATDDSNATPEDTPVGGSVGGNDSDIDSESLTWSLLTGPAHGSVAFNANDSYSYTPNADFCGGDSFAYQVSDGSLTDIATVNITVTCVNDAPSAGDDNASTDEDTTLHASVTGNDADVDTALLIWTLASSTVNGSLTFNGDGSYSYTPNADVCVGDSFTYQLSDGTLTDTATVTITVNCINDAPVAGDDSNSTNEDTTVSGSVTANDADVDDPTLTWALASSTLNGSLTFNGDGSYTYTPNADFCGGDSFTYQVSDGTLTDTATVTIAVNCINDAPVAGDDSNSTNEDTAVSGSVTANDADVDDPTLTWALASSPVSGSLTFNGDGSYTYTPNADFCGTDSFTYQVSDGTASDTGSVSVTVNCVNDAPVANDSAATTAEDTPLGGTATSSDIDGPGAAYTLATGPAHGTVTLNPGGTYTYTPALNYNGPDSFTFTVSDGAGGSDVGAVSINVTPVNDPPFCSAAAPTVDLLWPPDHQLVNVDVLGVTDPVEGSAITIRIDSIWQDEPTNTVGDGSTPIDGYGVGTNTAQVRAERSGNKRVPGDGRMYYINFTGTDAQGGTCTGTVKVGVPHDQGNGNSILEGGPLYSSTGQ